MVDTGEDVELFIARVERENGQWWVKDDHFVTLAGYEGGKAIINDPDSTKAFKSQPPPGSKTRTQTFFDQEYTDQTSEYWNTQRIDVMGVSLFELVGYGGDADRHWVITGAVAESVPEPSSLAMLASCIAAAGVCGRRRS